MRIPRSLVDTCIAHIQAHPYLLGNHKLDEQVVKLIANKQGLNISILQILDQKNWIKSIDLKSSSIADEGLAKISAVSGLTTLNISDCPNVTDFGILKFSGHENLCSLDISKTNISDLGVQGLALCPRMQVLDFSYTDVGDSSITQLHCLRELHTLILRNTKVSDELLKDWHNNQQYPSALHTLILPFTKVGDGSAKAIAALPSLHVVDLKSTKFSVSGLAILQDALRRKNKGAKIKALPGNKIEVVSFAKKASIPTEFTATWLHDAITDFVLMQGGYTHAQKRSVNISVPALQSSMSGIFANMSLASSFELSSSLSNSFSIPLPPLPAAMDLSSELFLPLPLEIPSIINSSIELELPSMPITIPPCPSPLIITPDPTPPSIISPLELNIPFTSPISQTSIPLSTPLSSVDLATSVYDDFPSDEEESEAEIITPKQSQKQRKSKPKSKSTSTSKSTPKSKLPPNITLPSVTVLLPITPKKAAITKRKPLAATNAELTTSIVKPVLEGKENELPDFLPTFISGKRKSPRLLNLSSAKMPKPEQSSTNNNQKQPTTTPKTQAKRALSQTITLSPYNTRSSMKEITIPTSPPLKKQKRAARRLPRKISNASKLATPQKDITIANQSQDGINFPEGFAPFVSLSSSTQESTSPSDISSPLPSFQLEQEISLPDTSSISETPLTPETTPTTCNLPPLDIVTELPSTNEFSLQSACSLLVNEPDTQTTKPSTETAITSETSEASHELSELPDTSVILPSENFDTSIPSTSDTSIVVNSDTTNNSTKISNQDDSILQISFDIPDAIMSAPDPSTTTIPPSSTSISLDPNTSVIMDTSIISATPSSPCSPPTVSTPVFLSPSSPSVSPLSLSPTSSSASIKVSKPKPLPFGFTHSTDSVSSSLSSLLSPPTSSRSLSSPLSSRKFIPARTSPYTPIPNKKRTHSAPTTPSSPFSSRSITLSSRSLSSPSSSSLLSPSTPSSFRRPTKPLSPAEQERNKQINSEFLRMRKLLLY